jgi:hypothetical protein
MGGGETADVGLVSPIDYVNTSTGPLKRAVERSPARYGARLRCPGDVLGRLTTPRS